MPPGQRLTSDNLDPKSRPERSNGATYMRRSVTGKPLHLVGNTRPISVPVAAQPNPSEPWKTFLPELDARKPKKREFLHEKPHHEVVSEFVYKAPKKQIGSLPKHEPKKPPPAAPRQRRSAVLHRSNFGPKVAAKTHKRIRRRSNRSNTYVLISMASFLFLVGLGVSFNSWRISRIAKAQVAVLAKNTTSQNTTDIPDETPPDSSSATSYRVAADMPRFLRIPKIQVDAKVLRLGVKSDNELKAPGNIFDVGWYDGSAKPGEKGTILLDGHISGPTKKGVFYSLGNLKEGDMVDLERGDAQVFHYKVVKTAVYDYDKVDMAAALTSATPGKPGLNLISCGGRFDVKTNKFEQRIVVFAVQQ